MLLIVGEGIRGGMCKATHKNAKANNKYMKNYNQNIESSYLQYLDANNLYEWTMSQKLHVNGFRFENDLSKFNDNFIKNYNKNSDRGYFLEVDVKYPKKLNQSMEIKHNYNTLILTVLLFILKLYIFTNTSVMMLKDGLIHLTMRKTIKDRFQQVKTKK